MKTVLTELHQCLLDHLYSPDISTVEFGPLRYSPDIYTVEIGPLRSLNSRQLRCKGDLDLMGVLPFL